MRLPQLNFLPVKTLPKNFLNQPWLVILRNLATVMLSPPFARVQMTGRSGWDRSVTGFGVRKIF